MTLFAEGSPDYTSLLTGATNILFSCVVGWYLLTKAIPAMQEKFAAALKEQREDFSGLLAREKETAKQILEIVARNVADAAKIRDEKLDRMCNQIDQMLAMLHDYGRHHPGGK